MRALILAATLSVASTASASPHDFSADAHALYAVAACGDTAPATFDKDVVATHCTAVRAQLASWQKAFRDKARPMFAKELAGAPTRVVYPFGGGDLITALVVYPDATEYTTLSLEGMGDPRALGTPKQLASKLSRLRDSLTVTFGWAWNTTIQLSIDSSESGQALPAILTSALVALEANDYEPLEVRYFTLAGDGTITYVSDADLDAWDKAHAKSGGGHKPTNAVQEGLFDDVEIVFRAKGDAKAPKKTFRHVTADLSDGALASHGAALAYLGKQGEVAAMTKAASYLLWKPGFGKLRDWLLANMAVMASDDTGIPPSLAPGFDYRVWGTYLGAHFDFADGKTAKEMVALWKGSANQGALDFRFGYYDNHDHSHLMIAKKRP